MATVTAHLDGQSELLGKIRAWERRKRAAVAAVIEEYSGLVLAAAVELAPRRSGRLVESLRADTTRLLTDLVADVGAGVFYGRFVELGTDRAGAHPFLLPAFERYARAYYDALRRALATP